MVRRLPRHRATRILAAALALLALGGQLSSFAHLALVRHVTCAEHGELIEVGSERALAAAVTSTSPVDTVAAVELGGEHGHEHCLLTPMRRDRAALGTPRAADSIHVDAYGTLGVGGDRALTPAIALYRLAPKNSPPLV